MPRSCLEDMAWGYSGTTKIGEYQVAAGGWGGTARRFVSICNNHSAKPGLAVTGRDKRKRSVGKSRSVTPTDQKRPKMLQIETNKFGPPKHLNL